MVAFAIKYDQAGNMLSDGAKVYFYDAWNRLTFTMANETCGAAYLYDGLGRRIIKWPLVSTTKLNYYYNHEWQLIEVQEVDNISSDTVMTDQYIWSARYIDSPIVRFHDGNADGDLLDASDNVRYYTGDANYNVTAAIDAATGDVVNYYSYTAYGEATVYEEDWDVIGAPTEDGPLYCGYFFDSETSNYQVRHRYLSTQLGTFINRDPLTFESGDFNLYRYGNNNPIIFVDPVGLAASQITGPCDIWIYAGHGIWPIGNGIEDPAVGKFRKKHDVSTGIVNGCGNYLGYVGCEGSTLNGGVTDGRQIPGMPDMGKMKAEDMLGAVQQALKAAEALQGKLCENRKKFCDDGTPERYKCGEDMQRCDSVTIHVSCDADMKVLMEKGIYQKRLWPGGPVVAKWPVPGLPTKESKSICGSSKKMDCNK
jgi:RHS repeat-associated protein